MKLKSGNAGMLNPTGGMRDNNENMYKYRGRRREDTCNHDLFQKFDEGSNTSFELGWRAKVIVLWYQIIKSYTR